jgi:hypothetical protein
MKKTKTQITIPNLEREISSLKEEGNISFFLYLLKKYSSQSSEEYLKYLIFKDSLLDVIAMMIDLSRGLQECEDFGRYFGDRVHILKQMYNSVLDESYRNLCQTAKKEVKL